MNSVYILPSLNGRLNRDYKLLYYLVGKMMAKVLIDGLFMEVTFPKYIFRMLLEGDYSVQMQLEDLKEFDPQCHSSLLYIL